MIKTNSKDSGIPQIKSTIGWNGRIVEESEGLN
jgi:hypothetical protein